MNSDLLTRHSVASNLNLPIPLDIFAVESRGPPSDLREYAINEWRGLLALAAVFEFLWFCDTVFV